MRIALIIIILVHACLHLIGFTKAFDLVQIDAIKQPISKSMGILWLISALVLSATAIAYILKFNFWWIIAIISVFLSQTLIIYFWGDARFGTIPNVLILLMSVFGIATWHFEEAYRADVREAVGRSANTEEVLLTENDLAHLPAPVHDYLKLAGVIGKPRVYNFKAEFTAEMRSRSQDWFSLNAEQYNFFDKPERLFFLLANVKGLPTYGYHRYKNGKASMCIKLLSLFPVVDLEGDMLFKAETVTLFNDMCFLAPATLIDRSIQWEIIDSFSVRAKFTNLDVTISAVLHFNAKGELVNFISDDRYEVADGRQYRFSTPLSRYERINEHYLPTYGEAIWHYPEGEFVYGKYTLKRIQYNVDK